MAKSNSSQKNKTFPTTTATASPKKASQTAAKTSTTKTLNVGRDEIAQRAYSIFLSGQGGTELDHWLQAERELLSTETAQLR